jgi:hypothetical protein
MVDASDASVAATTMAFSLGSMTTVNSSVGSTPFSLALRASSASGITGEFIYGTYAPNTPGAGDALFLNTINTNFHQYIVGHSYIVDAAPGTFTAEDAPLFPGDAYVNGAWFSPASGQSPDSPGVSSSVERSTTMLLIGVNGSRGGGGGGGVLTQFCTFLYEC